MTFEDYWQKYENHYTKESKELAQEVWDVVKEEKQEEIKGLKENIQSLVHLIGLILRKSK